MPNTLNTNLSPLGLLRVLQSLNLNLPTNTINAPQTSYQRPQSEILLNLILQQLPQLQKSQVPSSLSAPQSPVAEALRQYLSQGLLADLTASQLKSQVENLRNILQPISTKTPTTPPSQALPTLTQRTTPTATTQPNMSVNLPTMRMPTTNANSVSILKSLNKLYSPSR